ncbi:MAG: hypothetical protein ACJ79I_04430 [Gemmatimonadaceae bacterium]
MLRREISFTSSVGRQSKFIDTEGSRVAYFPNSIAEAFTIEDRNAIQRARILVTRERELRYFPRLCGEGCLSGIRETRS